MADYSSTLEEPLSEKQIKRISSVSYKTLERALKAYRCKEQPVRNWLRNATIQEGIELVEPIRKVDGPEAFKSSYFSKNPKVFLHTCHSTSVHRNKVSKSLAEQISIAIKGYVLGYDGRVSYYPVAENKPPIPGETISSDADIDSSKGKPDDYEVESMPFDNRIP